MPRPVKWRRIEHLPTVTFFVPAEEASPSVPENVLKLEELEAIRLKDLEGLEQSECADRMEISRPTFQRILLSAREKIADSLVNGKSIHVVGGHFTQNICLMKCMDCGNEWSDSFENMRAGKMRGTPCPECGSDNTSCGQNCSGPFGRGNCRRHGWH